MSRRRLSMFEFVHTRFDAVPIVDIVKESYPRKNVVVRPGSKKFVNEDGDSFRCENYEIHIEPFINLRAEFVAKIEDRVGT